MAPRSIPWLLIVLALGLVAASFQNDARNFEGVQPPVVFGEGFFNLEKTDKSSWRWLGDGLPKADGPLPLKGLVHLLNTKKDAILTIGAIVPVGLKPPPTIKFFFNGEPLDEFTQEFTPGKDRFEKTYKVPALKQSKEEYSELLITIDQFMIPSERSKKATDSRRLGLRLLKLTWADQAGIEPAAAPLKPTPDVPLPAAPPPAPAETPPRLGWLVLLGVVFALFLLVLALAVFQTLRTRKAAAPPQGRDMQAAVAAGTPLSFPCSTCGKPVKVKADLKGKKIKCPHCSQAILVAKPEPK